jgi:hypothetical protein
MSFFPHKPPISTPVQKLHLYVELPPKLPVGVGDFDGHPRKLHGLEICQLEPFDVQHRNGVFPL